MNWRDFPRAPAPGTALCPRAAVKGTLTLDLNGFPVLIVESPAGLRAYVNACPHQFLPLDHRAPGVLSADGARLICSSHQAVFDAATGAVLGGPAPDCLDAIPISLRDGVLYIAPEEGA
ncbi:MAG: Rieske 2Fe-2S domain-containing protein [Paracoccus sp. (in: a-proteobacteria)]|nr:Rieske 2Fe-2S domain-containing protein [Paracoccus sp. (in: a-proteobacteria)]